VVRVIAGLLDGGVLRVRDAFLAYSQPVGSTRERGRNQAGPCADPDLGVLDGMAMTARTIVQRFLIGDYPASRDELVERAERQGADQLVLGLIRSLPDRPYEAPIAVVHALEDAHRASGPGSRPSSHSPGT
jgi:hypothetical protein